MIFMNSIRSQRPCSLECPRTQAALTWLTCVISLMLACYDLLVATPVDVTVSNLRTSTESGRMAALRAASRISTRCRPGNGRGIVESASELAARIRQKVRVGSISGITCSMPSAMTSASDTWNFGLFSISNLSFSEQALCRM